MITYFANNIRVMASVRLCYLQSVYSIAKVVIFFCRANDERCFFSLQSVKSCAGGMKNLPLRLVRPYGSNIIHWQCAENAMQNALLLIQDSLGGRIR